MYDDGTLLIPLLLLFRLKVFLFLALEFLSQNTQTLIRTWACVLETYIRSDIGHNIYIARLIIEHPREWLASLADYDVYVVIQ